jgi:hypothetical protein
MNRFIGGQGAGAGSQGAGGSGAGDARSDTQVPVAPPKSPIPNPKPLSGLGAQIAGVQARLGRRPAREPGDTEGTE